MDFLKTKTAACLARSFAGESQARNRYEFYAAQARREQQEYLARLFEQTADNERAHAWAFWCELTKNGGAQIGSIALDAGYPFSFGSTEQNFAFAAEGERDEHASAYPAFAETAAAEGFADAAQLWRQIAAIEGEHLAVFETAKQMLSDGSLYRRDAPVVWRCLNCGHTLEAVEPWRICPVCGRPMGWVESDVRAQAARK